MYDFDTDEAERGMNVFQLDDESYIVGSSMIYDPMQNNFLYRKVLFSKFDENGNRLWMKDHGDFPYSFSGQEFIKTTEGFLFATTKSTLETDRSFNALSLNENGDTIWTNEYGSIMDDVVQNVIQTEDSGFLLIGSSNGFGNPNANIYVVKTDTRGNLEWEQAYGDCCDRYRAFGVVQTPDNGYLIAGHHEAPSDDYFQMYALKISENGDFEWDETYRDEIASATLNILALNDGNFLMIGQNVEVDNPNPLLVDQDALIRKIDDEGNTIWTKVYGQSKGPGDLFDTFNNGVELNDGSLVLTGTQFGEDKAWLTKLDSEGEMIWERFYERSEFSDFFYGIDTTADGGFIVVGNAREAAGVDTDIWLVKTDEFGCDTMGCEIFDSVIELAPIPNLRVYPNPSINEVIVQFPAIALNTRIEVIHVLGKVYSATEYDFIQSRQTVSIKDIPKGVYFIRITVDNKYREVRKVVKQ